jgi:hypothetical protein
VFIGCRTWVDEIRTNFREHKCDRIKLAQLAGSYEHGKESLGFIKGREVLH